MILNSIIGAKGKKSIGNVTVQNWKGLTVARQKPTDVANPQTAAQTAQRTKLSLAVKIFRQIASAVNVGFSQLAIRMAAYNAFMQYNLKAGVFGTDASTPIPTANLLKVARGTLTTRAMDTVSHSNNNTQLNLNWDAGEVGDQLETDELYAVVLGANGVCKYAGRTGAYRSSDDTSLAPIAGQTFVTGDRCYTFWYQPSTRKVSDSTYFAVTA